MAAAKKKAPAKKAAPKKKVPAKTQAKAKASKAPKTVGKNMVKPGPNGAQNGSGSGPMQGSAPQSMGGIGMGGFGM